MKASSLYQYNNVIAWIYEWSVLCNQGVGDLDLFLTEGGVLDRLQVRSLVEWIDTGGRPCLAGRIEAGHRLTFSEPKVILPKLSIIGSFLTFALDPGLRMGKPVSAAARDQGLQDMEAVFDLLAPNVVGKNRKTPGGPITTEVINAVRSLIACDQGRIPTELFSVRTAYRNWLIFEVALATGFRVSEVASLVVESIPRISNEIRLRDIRGAAWDRRLQEAGSKTFTRNLPVEGSLLQHLDNYVLEADQLWGRKAAPGVRALWVNQKGKPLSVRQTLRIFKQIGDAVGSRLTCHRARHRFIDDQLEVMDDEEAMTLTGHSSPAGLRPYRHEKSMARAERGRLETFRVTRRRHRGTGTDQL